MSAPGITGPAGPLEFIISAPPEPVTPTGWAIVCHPHPLHGGSLDNKVVHYVTRTLAEIGLESIRFNFRGVGNSAGIYDQGRGEQDDLRAVIEWCQRQDPGRPVWLAGFSFGAFVATAVAAQESPECLITVAPPVRMFDFSGFLRPSCPWYIVQGTEDEIVSCRAVEEWAETITPPPEMIILAGATHFFHGELNSLHDNLLRALHPLVSEKQGPIGG